MIVHLYLAIKQGVDYQFCIYRRLYLSGLVYYWYVVQGGGGLSESWLNG